MLLKIPRLQSAGTKNFYRDLKKYLKL